MSQQSYEANAHKAQMAILRTLLIQGVSSFSELARAAKLSNDHGTFHIKKLVTAGMVEHTPKSYGKYQLTRKGKEYANRMDTEELVIEKQPKLVVDCQAPVSCNTRSKLLDRWFCSLSRAA